MEWSQEQPVHQPPDERRTQPLELELERSSHLKVRWADGHESVYALALLRRSCPCAACREARQQQQTNPLHVMPAGSGVAAMALAAEARLVGNYGLRIRWQDGHDAGIYDFRQLRSQCPCAVCCSADR